MKECEKDYPEIMSSAFADDMVLRGQIDRTTMGGLIHIFE